MSSSENRVSRFLLVVLAAWLVLRGAESAWGETRRPFEPPASCDLVFGPDDFVRGRVVRSPSSLASPRPVREGGEGDPIPGCVVTIVEQGRVIGRARTDAKGRFALPVAGAGSYLIHAAAPGGPIAVPCRIWDATTAPLRARHELLLVAGDRTVVRGQSHRSLMARKAMFSAVAVGGALAVPIAYGAVRDATPIPTSP